MQELLRQTEGLSAEEFLQRFPYPFLVREATRGSVSVPEAQTQRGTTRLKGVAAVPVGDGFAQADVWVYPVCPRDPDNFDGAVRLGRDPGGDVVVDDGSISNHHADFTLEVEGDERLFFVSDVGSSNGTFVNGERLEPGQPTRIEDQDSVRFGPAVKFQFFHAEGFQQFLEFYRRIKR